MEGRIVLVKLLCKDTANARIGVFSPCIAFRVAGSPGNSFYSSTLVNSGDLMQSTSSITTCLGKQRNICIGRHAINPSVKSAGHYFFLSIVLQAFRAGIVFFSQKILILFVTSLSIYPTKDNTFDKCQSSCAYKFIQTHPSFINVTNLWACLFYYSS